MKTSTRRASTQSIFDSRSFIALLGAATTCFALAACSEPEPAPPVVEGGAIGTAGAHEHGIARLGLAVDGTRITMNLQVPAESVYGFEHAPQSDEERQTATAALAALRTGASNLLVFPADAGCTLEASEVEAPDVEASGDADDHDEEHAHDDDHDHDHDEEHADDEGHDHEQDDEESHQHGEVTLSGTFTCAQAPVGAASLAFGSVLPEVEQVDLTVVTGLGQAAARVAPDAAFSF